jgi:hypothetical protein
MAYPVFEDTGGIAGASSGTDITVNLPATVNADDILIIKLGGQSAAATWSTLDGDWTELFDETNGAALYWLRADGTEDGGSVLFTMSESGKTRTGCCYRFSGCITTGDPFEQEVDTATSYSAVDIPDLAGNTTGAERLVCSFAIVTDNRTGDNDATNFSEANDQTHVVGNDGAAHLYTYQQATAGKPGADTYNISDFGSDYIKVTVMALMPPSAGYGNDVTTVGSANIGKVNGVATANISKVIV